jgi:hypothetical protein
LLKRRLYTTAGATDLTTVNSRITVLENNTYEITYFEEFSSTTGQVTVPTGGTIALNQFAGGVDAYVSTVSSSQPTGVFPVTAGGVTVDVSSFDASGNFTLSGTPSAYPIAIIYVFRITGLYLSNINNDRVINLKDTSFQPLDADLTSIAALSPSNDDIIQRKAGIWANRTMAQLRVDLIASYSPIHLTTSLSHTGDTNQTILYASSVINGNTFLSGDVWMLKQKISATSNGNAKTFRAYFNTTNDLSGSPVQIAQAQIASGAGGSTMFVRNFKITSSTNLVGSTPTTNLLTDEGSTAVTQDSITVDFTQNLYYIISVQLAVNTDTAFVRDIRTLIQRQ